MQATFFTNSFNRLPLLQNLLQSFELCNQSADIEWVITDYGSTDGSRQWLTDYAKHASFPVQLLFDDEKTHFAQLKMAKVGMRERREAILRKFRNDARHLARGHLIFDIGSDQQFIRPADFVAEINNIFNQRQAHHGHLDLSGIFTIGYFRWRLSKPLNQREEEEQASEVPYFVARHKPYVDYLVMARQVIDLIGPYLDLTTLQPGSQQMQQWEQGDDTIRPETEYMRRCQSLGLRMAFLKYPFLISFRNKEAADIVAQKKSSDKPLVPLWTLEEMIQRFGWLTRPVSSEELRRTMVPSIWERGLATLKKWI